MHSRYLNLHLNYMLVRRLNYKTPEIVNTLVHCAPEKCIRWNQGYELPPDWPPYSQNILLSPVFIGSGHAASSTGLGAELWSMAGDAAALALLWCGAMGNKPNTLLFFGHLLRSDQTSVHHSLYRAFCKNITTNSTWTQPELAQFQNSQHGPALSNPDLPGAGQPIPYRLFTWALNSVNEN